MSARFRRGLVVGKFAPLHRGHEFVIQCALEECAEVLLVSYAHPEPAGCSAERRAFWLATRFPQTQRLIVTDALLADLPTTWPGPRTVPPDTAVASIHRSFVGQLCLHVLGGPVDAVFTSEDYGDGFASELTTLFQISHPAHPPVAHVPVDLQRLAVPISATAIRADVHARRAWLAPEVYASFVHRVAILGGESSGKSTLAMEVARALGTSHVAEYGRELWKSRNGQLREEDLLQIAQTQMAREESARRTANAWVVCDTTPLTTLFYAREMFGRAVPELEQLATRSYQATILCAPDFPFVQDGTRQDEAFRARQHAWYLAEFERRGISTILVTGSVENRVRQVISALRLEDRHTGGLLSAATSS